MNSADRPPGNDYTGAYQAPERWSLSKRFGVGLLVGVPGLAVVAFVVALFLAQARLDAAGCGSVDPTDPANYSTLTIVNDTTRPVIVESCLGAYCDTKAAPRTLRPGEKIGESAACGVSGSDMTSWRIDSVGGQFLGYIAVDSPRSVEGLAFRVSRVSHDPRTATPEG